MKVLVHGTQLVAALSQLDTLTGGSGELVTLKFDGKHDLWLHKVAKETELIRVGVRMEVNGKKAGKITVNAAVLAGLCRRNQDLLLEYRNKELHVSNQQAYQAKCLTVKNNLTTQVVPKKTAKTALPKRFQKVLAEALTKLDLKDHFQSEVGIVLSVWATKKQTLIGASDNFHGGLYQAKGLVDLEFHLPIEYANRLQSLLEEQQDLQIGVDPTSFYLWNDQLQIAWPLVAPKSDAKRYREIFSPAKTGVATMQASTLGPILTNLKQLYEKLSHLRLNVTKSAITFQVRSTKGSAAESIKYTGKLPKTQLAVNPQLFEDIVGLVPEEFTLGFSSDMKTIIFQGQLDHGTIIYHTILSTLKSK